MRHHQHVLRDRGRRRARRPRRTRRAPARRCAGRTGRAPAPGILPDLQNGEERGARLGADGLDDWTARFVAQLAAPRAQHISLSGADGPEHVLVDVEGAWAALAQRSEEWTVRRGGPVRLWDAVEVHLLRWRTEGAPPLERFEVLATPEDQSITWPTA
ncbi:hypothetical protein [Streptomyces sp. NPDC059262]|uniref:hypothetical protein n=1 Tax=Streptomyces sp. NPDC059262 TaxID=3346797 RepID=UPI003676E9B6